MGGFVRLVKAGEGGCVYVSRVGEDALSSFFPTRGRARESDEMRGQKCTSSFVPMLTQGICSEDGVGGY